MTKNKRNRRKQNNRPVRSVAPRQSLPIQPAQPQRDSKYQVMPVEIARALVAIQKTLKPMVKSEVNDEYDSGYVPLDQVTDKAMELLNKHDIAVSQPVTTTESDHLGLETILVHESGVGISRSTRMALAKPTPQGHGSAITYTRRYALMGMLGLTAKDEDDDGNTGSGVDVKASEEQIEELKGMLRHLKWPAKDIAKEVWRARTRDQAAIMIDNYRKIISQRVADIEGAKAALAVEKGTDGIEPSEEDATPQATLMARIKALKLATKGHENKLINRATGKPFISKVKTEEDLKALDRMITALETGEVALPAEFYAPRGEPIVVNEDVA